MKICMFTDTYLQSVWFSNYGNLSAGPYEIVFQEIRFGPTLLPSGQLTVTLRQSGETVLLDLDIDNRKEAIDMIVTISGYHRHKLSGACHVMEKLYDCENCLSH
jgi:hypothetical protein